MWTSCNLTTVYTNHRYRPVISQLSVCACCWYVLYAWVYIVTFLYVAFITGHYKSLLASLDLLWSINRLECQSLLWIVLENVSLIFHFHHIYFCCCCLCIIRFCYCFAAICCIYAVLKQMQFTFHIAFHFYYGVLWFWWYFDYIFCARDRSIIRTYCKVTVDLINVTLLISCFIDVVCSVY